MALLRCDFFSDALRLSTSMQVVLPQPVYSQIGMGGSGGDEPPPVLYLLHGLSDDCTTWTRRTSIERYASELGLAVVMPQVARSFYLDGAHTGAYWEFLSAELPTVVQRFFRVSHAREDTFVAGLSMGGYGALLSGLRQPERFAAAASLSGALDAAELQREDALDVFSHVTDAPLGGTSADLFALLDSVEPATAPQLYVRCGTEDGLVDSNRRFATAARERGLDVTDGFDPGAHTWDYWDRTVQDVLAWLPLRTR
ncbi:MAG: alpha/beta hydrolase family protein [Quadrisphaera sp.]